MMAERTRIRVIPGDMANTCDGGTGRRLTSWLAVMMCVVGILLPLRMARAADGAETLFLLPVSARETALGQSTVASVSDVTAFHWNPAGLGRITDVDAMASYTRLYGNLASHQSVAVATPLGNGLAGSIAWIRSGVDDIPIYPSLNPDDAVADRATLARMYGVNPLGMMTFAQNAYVLSIARRNDVRLNLGWEYLTLPVTLPVGVSMKYVTVTAGDSASASGIGFDVGTQMVFELSRALDNPDLGTMSLGLTLVNIGDLTLTWDTPQLPDQEGYSDRMKMTYVFGGSYLQPLPWFDSNVTGSLAYLSDGYAWGVEYNFLRYLSLRVGDDMIDENSLSVGAGIEWMGLSFDYALQNHTLGVSHRVSLRYHR
jgi:hypothetical protein